MDEFQKNDILDNEAEPVTDEAADIPEEQEETPQESDTGVLEEAPSQDADALAQELEEIRDMFQKELDAAMETAEGEILIQELDNHEEVVAAEDEEMPLLPLCDCCGENPRSTDYGEDYLYCDSCREALKRYPLRWSGVLAFIAAIILVCVTGYFSVDYLESSVSAGEAIMNFEQGKIISGMQAAYTYLGSCGEDAVSKKVVRKTIDAGIATGYYSDAAAFIENYFTETELKLPWNKKYKKILEENTVLKETYYAVSELVSPAAEGKDYDYDALMSELDDLSRINPFETGKSETVTAYNKTFIEYYKYILMSIAEKPYEEQLSQLKAVDAIGAGFEWVYLANYCAVAARLGDEAAMNYAFDKAVSINRQDMNVYLAKASYYRFLETPDADKILEICKEAEEFAVSGDLTYKQYEAIAYLIKGEGAMALETIEEAISSSYTVEACNLYALIGLYNGNTEIYDEMKTLLEQNNFEISKLVTKYKNNKISIAEIIADKGGDI